jgi:hypothetical protein
MKNKSMIGFTLRHSLPAAVQNGEENRHEKQGRHCGE